MSFLDKINKAEEDYLKDEESNSQQDKNEA